MKRLFIILVAAVLLCCASRIHATVTSAGFDFRSTAGYVTDAATNSPVLGETYPHTYTNAQSVAIVAGFESGGNCAVGIATRDRNAANDARLAGMNFPTNGNAGANTYQCLFRVDLPIIGSWSITLAAGDAGSPQSQYIQFADNGVVFATYAGVATGSNSFMDANGTVYTNANWLTSNTPLSHVFTSTLFEVIVGPNPATGSASSTIAHLAIVGGFNPHTGGQLISAPLLPQATPSATYPPDTGYTLTAVASGANLQTAISAAACGTKLNLAHGGTFTAGSAWTLPNNSCACHTDATKWQIIQGDQFEANYVPGVRVDPSAQYAQFPHLSNSDANYAFTANTNGASCWGFAGLDVTETTDGATAVLSLGDGSVTVANYPHDLAGWGSYIHGQASKGVTRCIVFNGNWGAVIDSYLSDCHKVGQDTQAVEMWDGLGPLLVQNTFLEGAAENILIGGSDPHAGVIPSDFTFQRNHFFKSLSWRVADPSYAGIHWSVKNCFELKDAQRVLVTGNVFENGWGDAQAGQCITWNSSNQNGTDPQAVVADVAMFYNVIRHFTQVSVIGGNTPITYVSNHRINIHDNLSWDIDSCKWGNCFQGRNSDVSIGGINPGTLFAPFDLWFNHETIASNPATQGYGIQFQPTDSTPYYGFQAANSIIDIGAYGAMGRTIGSGDAIVAVTPGLKVNNDCIYGPNSGSTYNDAAFNGKQFAAAGQSAVFVNPGVDFHVAPASVCHNAASDGTDMGANIDAVNAATAGVARTLGNLHTVTNVSPSTFTHLGSTSITITGTNFISGAAEVIVGGAGPAVAVSTDICAVNTCTVVTSTPTTLAVNDTVNMAGMNANLSDQGQFLVASVTDATHFTYTDTGIGVQSWLGGAANRITPGNACTSVVVVNSTTITCVTPAATGTVTNGPVSVFVSQFGIQAQFNGANYN